MGYRLPLSVQVILLNEIKKKMLIKKSVIPTHLDLKGVVAFNGTFNDISVILWGSVLLVEESGVPGENHRPVASH